MWSATFCNISCRKDGHLESNRQADQREIKWKPVSGEHQRTGMRVVAEHKEVQQVAWERWEQPGTPRMSWHRRDRRGPRQGQINNEKPQVCGLRAPAKGLLADFAPPRKGGGEAAGIRYVAKTGKVLFRLTRHYSGTSSYIVYRLHHSSL